jgi:hypothetical protein
MVTRSLTIAAAMMLAAHVATAAPPASEPARLATPSGTIVGTLVLPAVSQRTPVVLIIAGSGPTDRDGNSLAMPGRNDSLKMLADALAAEGIASLRYDKRGVGGSAAAGVHERDLRFDTLVDDAAAWIVQLRRDARFSRVIVAGHSEGAFIGLLAARLTRADAYVSIAGPGRRASEVLRDQLRPQIGTNSTLWQANESVLASLEDGKTMDPLPAAIEAIPAMGIGLYRPAIQPYLISWFKYVPSEEIAGLDMPVLLVQGSTDIQVGVDEAKVLKAAKPNAELVMIDDMNHVLKQAPADRQANLATYTDPTLPIVKEVPAAIAALVKRLENR